MFGFVRPYLQNLSEEEKARYRAVYCGLCRTLNDRHGLPGRIALNYDLTFFLLMYASLYEPDEFHQNKRCSPHPAKKHMEITLEQSAYAADMTVLLTYYKQLDNWQDDHSYAAKAYAAQLKKRLPEIEKQWPRQCKAVKDCMEAILSVEKTPTIQAEFAAEYTGIMLGTVYAVRDDFWKDQMYAFGSALGKFIYMMDAVIDYKDDLRNNRYNPLQRMEVSAQEARPLLLQPLGQAAEVFETLPLVQDAHLLRNILYSGVWQSYNEKMKKKEKTDGQ